MNMINSLEASSRKVSVYTTLVILKNMRERLGLEAMCSFLDGYTRMIERTSPDIREVVLRELQEKALRQLYESALVEEQK